MSLGTGQVSLDSSPDKKQFWLNRRIDFSLEWSIKEIRFWGESSSLIQVKLELVSNGIQITNNILHQDKNYIKHIWFVY